MRQSGGGVASTDSEATRLFTAEANPPKSSGHRPRRLVTAIIKLLFVALLVYLMGRQVLKLRDEWLARGFSPTQLHLRYGWLCVALAIYLIGQHLFARFWQHLLLDAGLRPKGAIVFRAYCVGTLAKYIPGKAGVVLLRAGLIPGAMQTRMTVALATIFETLASLALASIVAAGSMICASLRQWLAALTSAAVGTGLLFTLHPGVFGRISRLLTKPLRRYAPDVASPRWHVTLWRCGIWSIGGWLASGTSLWAVLLAMNVDAATVSDWLLTIGAATAATVGGVLVLFIPAGIGVRELMLIYLLEPRFGAANVVLAALLLRTVWTLGEFLAGGIWYASATFFRSASVEPTGSGKEQP